MEMQGNDQAASNPTAVRNVPEQALDQAEQYLARVFSCADLNHRPTAEIYRLSLVRAAQRINAGWRPPAEMPKGAADGRLPDLFLRGEGTAQDVVKHEVELVSFPDIYFRIIEVVNSPMSSAADMANVVSQDTSLSVKLLKVVNSPFYGFAAKIDSISRAIALVGAIELSTLALGVSAMTAFKNIPTELVDMQDFWKHSIACGTFARILAKQKKGLSGERFFVAGMLHDVGRLILFKKLPFACTEAMLYSRSNNIPLVEAEKDVLGFDHTKVGSLLFKAWNFPPGLQAIVRYHHEPAAAPDVVEAGIVHLADILAISCQMALRGSVFVPALDKVAWDTMGFPLDVLDRVMTQGEKEIQQMIKAILEK